MMFDNATNFYRKFGVAEGRDLQFSFRCTEVLKPLDCAIGDFRIFLLLARCRLV